MLMQSMANGTACYRSVEPQRLPRTVQTSQSLSAVHSNISGQKQELSHSCCKMYICNQLKKASQAADAV